MKSLKISVMFILIFSLILTYGIGQAYAFSYGNATDTESNDNPNEAQQIQVNTIIKGSLGASKGNINDNVDYYKFNLTNNGELTITVSMDSTLKGARTSLTNGSGASYASIDGYGTTTAALGVGTYYIDINAYNLAGNYTITVLFMPQGLAEDNEINNTYDQAQTIELNKSITGNLGYMTQRVRSSGDVDNVDIFKFTLPSKGTFKLTLSDDSTLKEIRTGISNGKGAGYGSFDGHGSQEFVLEAGTYYIDIYDYNGYGGYTLTNYFTPTSSPAATPAPNANPTPEPVKPNPDSDESDDTLAALDVIPNNVILDQGKTLQLKANAKYSSGSVEDVTDFVEWYSSDKKIVTVDENGLLKAVAAGNTAIVAKLEGKSLNINVRVNPVITEKKAVKITVLRATVYLKVGQQGFNSVTCQFDDKTKQDVTSKAVITSLNKNIAAIYKNGYFKALKAGTVKIQVTYKGVTTYFNVVVK